MFKFDSTLMTCVEADLKTGSIPMLLGEPGIGKSSWVEALAQRMHTQCFTLPCNQLADKADLTGARLVPVDVQVKDATGNVTVQKSYKQVFYPHAVLHDAIEYAKNNPRETPILFLDELNRTTPDVTSEALSIPTLRKIGSASLPANLKVVTAGNDKGNVTSLDEASVSRFVLYPVEPDLATFIAVNPELNPFIKTVLQKDPSLLFNKRSIAHDASVSATSQTGGKNGKKDDDDIDLDLILDDAEEMTQLTTPRTISSLSRWLNQFDNRQLLQMMSIPVAENVSALEACIKGHVGDTNFATFLIAEISSNISNTSNQSAAFQFVKPSCYDQMKACPDMATLDAFIKNMSPNEVSACVVYALTEPVDNSRQLQVLAQHIENLTSDDARAVLELHQNDRLDADNMAALLNTGTRLGVFISVFTSST